MQVDDLDSGLFRCPPTGMEVFLAWFTVHWVLGIVLLTFFGWFLLIVFSGVKSVVTPKKEIPDGRT